MDGGRSLFFETVMMESGIVCGTVGNDISVGE